MKKYSTSTLRRYGEITAILARNGLGWFAERLGIKRRLPFYRRIPGYSRTPMTHSQPEHVRMILEELGATAIKLGQVLSTRPDLIPREYIDELAKLQDNAPPITFDEVVGVIKEELGGHPDEVFEKFEHQPRASASIGQVHAAVLKNGVPVVVKVQRPGIREQIEQDLEVLANIAHQAARHTEFGKHLDVESLVEEFTFILRNELDYTMEGRNAEEIRNDLSSEPAVYVPRVFWKYSTKRVLTMEDVYGIKVSNKEVLEEQGMNTRHITENIVRTVITMVFKHGFFHADPHPGNFFILPDEVIALVDYGMVGRVNPKMRDGLLRLVMALDKRDSERLLNELLALGMAQSRVDRSKLHRDLDRFLHKYHGLPMKDLSAAKVFHEMMVISLKHRLQLPSDLTSLFKVIAMTEDLAQKLDPDFNLMEFAHPLFKEFWMEQYSLSSQYQRFVDGALDISELGMNLPGRLRRILSQVDRGDFQVGIRFDNMEEFFDRLNAATNRLALSVLTAAFIVLMGLLATVYLPAGLEHYRGWVFFIILAITVISGLRLAWQLLRSGR